MTASVALGCAQSRCVCHRLRSGPSRPGSRRCGSRPSGSSYRSRWAARCRACSCSARMALIRRAALLTGRLRSSSASVRIRATLALASRALRWIDGAHSELVAAYLLDSQFTGQQREPFLLVSAPGHSSVRARCFDDASGIRHAGVSFRVAASATHVRSVWRVRGGSLSHTSRTLSSLSLRLLLRGLVLSAGFCVCRTC